MSAAQSEKKLVRLQKYIADSGVTSRRKAEEYILQGRVKVNDVVVRELGTKICEEVDSVSVDGALIDKSFVERIYIVFHKPRCCVTTVNDPEGRETVMDYLKMIPQRVFPVGRLDYYSEGLLILTNDGELANKIMHPSNEVTKVYEVKVFGRVDATLLSQLKAGVESYDGPLKPKSVRLIKELPTKTWLEISMTEGKNREIRRLCEILGMTVDKLKRVAIEGLSVTGIAAGNFHMLTKKELCQKLGLDPKTGNKIAKVAFHSEKKGLNLVPSSQRSLGARVRGGKLGETVLKANDETYIKYRRKHYVETMKKNKEIEQERARKPARNATPTTPAVPSETRTPVKRAPVKRAPLQRTALKKAPLKRGTTQRTPFKKSPSTKRSSR